MPSSAETAAGTQDPVTSAWPYVLPFFVLIALLGARNDLPLPAAYVYPVRTAAVLAALLVFSRRVVELRPQRACASALLGAALFVIWIAPDLLLPGWRARWWFSNDLVGRPEPVQPAAGAFLLFRAAGSVLVVPVVEELFWRAFLMRWLAVKPFWKAPLGVYAPAAFWITALLFASEHGPYWDVGLAAGIAYGWWMVRTRSLADCILAHAVTNACLAAYVVAAGRWEYWL